ncbi:MAG TPA: AlkA N-terminal domain-containing protein [Pyrinomonadaceae bacterium]|nr:AlkA N-terminal domain-containing protein [Pyrinomonadaceae bacterium]
MEIIIRPRAPFDFAATARFLRFTEREAVDTFAEGRYRRALHLGGRLHLLNVASRGTAARPLLSVTIEGGGRATVREKEEAEARVRQIFSAEHDLKKFRARVAGDALMSKLEAAHRGLHIARWPSVFEALVISILSQQISTVVAMTLKRRVVEKYGERLESGGETFLAFPRDEALAEAEPQELRALGLSGSKVAAVTELAQKARDGELDENVLGREENEALIARLTKLRGIGRWTAEWALMLHFGRTDVFPAGDLALRGFVVKYYNDGRAMPEREIRALAASLWGEWASYAAVYFLAAMRAGTIDLRPLRAIINEGPGA